MSFNGYDQVLTGLPDKIKSFFSGLLSTSPLPLIILDSELRIISANNRFLKKSTLKRKELEGKEIQNIFPDSYQKIKKATKKLSAGEQMGLKQVCIKSKKNKKITGNGLMSLYQSKSKGFYLFYFTDIQTDDGTDMLNKDYFDDFLYKISRRGKWILDISSQNFFGNRICFQLLGLKNQKSLKFNKIIEKISNREERDALIKEINGIGNKKKVEHEISIRNPENPEKGKRYLRLIFSRIKKDETEYIAGILEDVSDIKKIEKELLKSRKRLEKGDRFKSAFLKNLGQELRGPMNSILGFSELLTQPDLTPEKIEEYSSLVKTKGDQLLALIDDVIEISRFENGNIDFNISKFSLLPLLKELFEKYETRRIERGKTNIELKLKVPVGAEKQTIRTDYGRLQQLLSNLLSNALKFTEKGRVTFGYTLSSKNVKFFVADTGPGLSEEDQERIFKRFEYTGDERNRNLSGTGLSLTISKYIAEALGGKIKVNSEIRKGSRFQLNIPLIQAKKGKDKKETDINPFERQNWKNKVILIAEDEDMNYDFLEAVLQHSEAQILHAKNGREAVELCRNIREIDLVLMDIKMPVMNGYDAMIKLRKYRTNLPVIALTASSSRDEIRKIMQLGFSDHISKPIDVNLLLQKINAQFGKNH